MSLSPAAIGIIFNEDDTKILLVKRKDIPLWVLPGGGVEQEETAEEAIIREVKEETGFTIQIERKCAEYTPLNKLAALTSVFICRIKEGEALLSPETSAIHFYFLTQLPSSFFHIHLDWLQDALNHSTLVQKPLANITYWNVFKYLLRHPFHVIRYAWTRLITRYTHSS